MDNLKLEAICDQCEGEGGWDSYGDWSECGQCAGAGYIPNELGEAILDLIRHNLRGSASVLLSSHLHLYKGPGQSHR